MQAKINWKRNSPTLLHILLIATVTLSLFFGLTTLVKVVKFSQLENLKERFSDSLIYTNVLLVLLTLFFIVVKVLLIVRQNRKGNFGTKLQNKLLLIISLITITPALLIFSFSYLFITNSSHYSISPTIEHSLKESLSVSQIYIDEQKQILSNNLKSLKRHVENNTKKILNNPSQFEKEFSGQAALLSLTEAVLFINNKQNRSNKIVAKTSFSFFSNIDELDLENDFKPNDLGYQIIINEDDNYIRCLSKIDTLPNAYILVGKLANDIAIRHVKNTKNAALDLYRLKNNISESRRNISITFFIVVILIILTSELIAIYLASFLTKPLAQIIEGSEELIQGNYRYQIVSNNKISELNLVIQSFNHMTKLINKDKVHMNLSKELINDHKDFLTNLLGNLPTAILLLDSKKKIKIHNKSAQKILIEKNLSNQYITTHLQGVEPYLIKAEQNPEQVNSFLFNAKINGKIKKLLLYIILDVYKGEIRGYILNFCDLTKKSK